MAVAVAAVVVAVVAVVVVAVAVLVMVAVVALWRTVRGEIKLVHFVLAYHTWAEAGLQ